MPYKRIFSFLVIVLLGCATQISSSLAVSYVEQEVYDALNTDTSANVIVEVEDNTGIVIKQEMAPEEKYDLYLERTAILANTTTFVLAQLPESEFTLTGRSKSGRGFYGIVTQEGFETLLHIPQVDKIYLNGVGSLHTTRPCDDIVDVTNESVNGTVENEPIAITPPVPAESISQPSIFNRILDFLKSFFT